jgi:membrane complex biogenesis BtpA family protein
MESFRKLFPHLKHNLIGMIHLRALPGTPRNNGVKINAIIDVALKEAELLSRFDGLIIENMHDIPYLRQEKVGPEIVASMTTACAEVRKNFPKEKPIGVQILAGANEAAIAVASASGLEFVRAEAFIYGHVADEGWMNATAGDLLRFRKNVNAENVQIFTDIKVKSVQFPKFQSAQ